MSDPLAKAVSSGDAWFYRLDGSEHGPFTLATLQNLIGTSEEIAAQVALSPSWTGEMDSIL